MTYNIKDKAALVTGASRGIGRCIAQGLAAAGARVGVHYVANEAAAKETLESLEGTGHAMLRADIADSGATETLIRGAAEKLRGLDVLVNNAGIYEIHPILDVDFATWQDVWQRTIDTNLVGPAHLTFHAARIMEKTGGRIINITSRGAFRGEPDAPAYGASKAGLGAFGQSMAKALAKKNIYVTTVAPGFVETDMAADLLDGEAGDSIRAQSPLDRVARPEEVADVVVFLAATDATYTTGAIIDINGASYLRS